MRMLFAALLLLLALPAQAEPVHGIAMHGAPKYGPGFSHFDYVNPDAPKGGTLRLATVADTFDTLNSFTFQGISPSGMGLIYDTLTVDSADEPFSQYGLLAESIEVPKDRSWVTFNLRKEARFSDGTPVTAEDVAFTFDILTTKGHPFYRFYYGNVDKVTVLSPLKIKFDFKPGENRELPLILGQMAVLPKHYWQGKDFEATTMDIPIGSGPYKISKFESGRFIIYERNKDYWGRDLPVNRGLYNFDVVQYDYYRDATVALEALKAGDYDLRDENNSKMWATAYESDAITEGRLIKQELPQQRGGGMQGWVFNGRRAMFKDPRTREALGLAFDFEWSNKTLFYGQYSRTRSFFSNTGLEAEGLPSPAELAILEPLRGKIPDEVFTKVYEPPKTDGSGNIRDNLRKAIQLLKEAGWVIKDRKLVDGETGQPFTFEILLNSPAFERIALPFAKNLEKLGIDARVRTVDTAQYKNRLDTFDFDMIVHTFGQSLSPGNEQRDFWSSASADRKGGRNFIGIKDKVIDGLVEKIIAASDRQGLEAACAALDRVLLWNHFVIPQWYSPNDRVAYWDKFGKPRTVPMKGYQLFSWWMKK